MVADSMTLHFDKLEVGYATPLIHDFDATLNASRILVRGANGVGKSALLLTIAGLLRPGSGSVLFDGTPTRAMLGRIGMVSDAIPFPADLTLSALGRLATKRGAPRQAWHAWLDRLGLHEPPGATLGTLSEGGRKKAFLAVAMVKSPDLLLLDEVANGLDAQSLSTLSRIVDEFAGTVVYATHGEAFPGTSPWTSLEIADRAVAVR